MSEHESDVATEARERSGRSGWTLGVRTLAVGIFDALVLFAVPQLVSNGAWLLLSFLLGAAVLVNWAYLNPRAQASRWLTPGLILMAIFVVFPVVYTFYISLTNWATGNVLEKDQVVAALESRIIRGEEGARTLALSVYRDGGGNLALLVSGPDEVFFGTPRTEADEPLEDAAIELDDEIDPASPPETIGDYQLVPTLQLTRIASDLQELVLDLPDGGQARVETLSTARVTSGQRRFTYDEATDTLTDNRLGLTCPAGEGSFFCDDVDEELVSRAAIQRSGSTIVCEGGVCDDVPLFALDGSLPGWRTVIGFDNYGDIFANERIRAPFVRVFAWNVAFAFLTVILTFALGLGLALLLKDEDMRGRPIYRSIFILPYAIPAFLSIFIWRGLLNPDFGKVNELLAVVGIPAIDWLGSPGWAMASVLLVNLWLGFPYMFLISSGALTSIPDELLEAARVDGAGPWKAFRSITLPLLLVATAPLLIGAFAFNFNNFVLIFLLTAGGPPLSGYDVPVGATDLLISFTFNLASGAGRGNQFALASAIIVIIFVVLAVVSGTSFRLTKRLEQIYGD